MSLTITVTEETTVVDGDTTRIVEVKETTEGEVVEIKPASMVRSNSARAL